MNYLVTPEVPDHLPLATLPCLPEQCNHCGKNFTRKSNLSKHMLIVHGDSRPSQIQQDRNLAKLMASKRITYVVCYIAFKTSISFKKHMKRGVHLLSPGHENVEGRFVKGIHVFAGWYQIGGTKHTREREGSPCDVCDKAFKSL